MRVACYNLNMFFRTKTIRGTSILQLVESYRNPEGLPRQRVLASLGNASLPTAERGAIAKDVELRLRGEQSLFPAKLSQKGAEWALRIVKIAEQSKSVPLAPSISHLNGVIVEKIRTDHVVGFGPHLVGMKAWEALGLSMILSQLGMAPDRIALAQLMVLNRLIEPLSEWALIDWSHRTALPEMLRVEVTKTTKDRLYKTSDELLKIRREIEKALRCGEQELFNLRRSIVLYDVTNTHFEGLCQGNPKAKHGKNKQKRNDCRQMALGMAFDEHGFALAMKSSSLWWFWMPDSHRKKTSWRSKNVNVPISSISLAEVEPATPNTLKTKRLPHCPDASPTGKSRSSALWTLRTRIVDSCSAGVLSVGKRNKR